MKFLMRLEMPTAAENPAVTDPDFNDKMRTLLLQISAVSASFGIKDGRRTDSIILDVKDETELLLAAAPFHAWLGVKAEFLPELTPAQAEKIKPQVEAVIRRKTTPEQERP